MSASSSASSASVSLMPSGLNTLIPLSVYGLWEAEIMTPMSARIEVIRNETAGGGKGPVRIASPPIEATPEDRAVSSM